MKKYVKKLGILLLMVILGSFIVLLQKLNQSIDTQPVTGKAQKEDSQLIILDPGHGGTDSGKVGVNKVLEKDINLTIAKKLKKRLEEEGIRVVMTRSSDSTNQTSKMEDMQARVEIINQSNAVLAVSIHQNSYTDASVHGGQIFYHAKSKEGEKAALILQEALKLADTDNRRVAKENTSYYMLRKTEKPLVIVECGFLSNYEEAQKLNTEAYQEEMAEAICSGVLQYLDTL